MKIKALMQNKKYLLLSYSIPFLIILIIYGYLKIYPFGSFSILKSDLLQSYVPAFNDFREKLFSGSSILYAWSGGLGNHLFVETIHLLLSPFNLVMLLFPRENLTEAVALLLLIKIPVSAITFHIFIKKKLELSSLNCVVFSVMYALCAFVTSLYWNIMWLDAVIMLPIVALGLISLVERNKTVLYSISLAAIIMVNYGTAIFLCGFSVIYFIILLITNKEHLDKIALKKRVISFVTRSLLAGAMGAVFLVPVFISLQSTYYAAGQFPNNIEFYNSITKFYTAHFFGMQPTALAFSDSVPNIYSGVLSILLFPLLFFNKNIKRREKILYFVVLLILFLCFNINILTFIVHGFHFPSMMPHRYSFVYSFFLVLIAATVVKNIDYVKSRYVFGSCVLNAIFLFILYKIYPQSAKPKPGRISERTLYISLVFICFYFVIWYLHKKINRENAKRVLAVVFVAVISLEAAGNAVIQFSHMNDNNRESYIVEFNQAMEKITAELDNETEFYRGEFKHYGSLSDSRLFQYKGINAFVGMSAPVTELMDKIGLTASANLLLFTNPTPLLNSIFGVKYLFNRRSKMQEEFTLFQFKKQVDNVFVYKNPYVLPVGFMADSALENWNPAETRNPFEVQNDYARKAAGIQETMYRQISMNKLELDKIKVNQTDENLLNYTIPDNISAEMEPKIILNYIAEESCYSYFHVRTGGATFGNISVNGNPVLKQAMRFPATALDAGHVNKGDLIQIELVMNQKTKDEEEELIRNGTVEVYGAQMDFACYETVISKLKEAPFQVSYYDNTSIKGTIAVEKEGLLFTSVPYDKNWMVVVDGKAANITSVGGGLIGIKLYPGNHAISFKYHERGLAAGAIISAVSLGIFIVLEYGKRKSGEIEIEA